jgi:hypothetical protein
LPGVSWKDYAARKSTVLPIFVGLKVRTQGWLVNNLSLRSRKWRNVLEWLRLRGKRFS